MTAAPQGKERGELEALGDGWFAHNGGECPVPHDTWIDEVSYRTGDTAEAKCRAHLLSWKNDPWFPMLDVVAFKPETPND